MTLRTDRVASLIKEEIGSYVVREFQDPANGLITVIDVHVSPDLRIAKIYVSILGDKEKKHNTLQMLEDNKREMRSFLGSQLRIKFTPAIHFYLDETLDRVDRIAQLLKKIHNDDQEKNK